MSKLREGLIRRADGVKGLICTKGAGRTDYEHKERRADKES